jgi:hypothetical protein
MAIATFVGKLGPIMAHGGPKVGPIMGPGQAWANHGPWGAQVWSHNGPWASLGPSWPISPYEVWSLEHGVRNIFEFRTGRSQHFGV